MKKSFKKIAASLVAATMLVTGMTGIVSSAANVTEETASVASVDNVNSSLDYHFTNAGQSGAYALGELLTLTQSKRITISFSGATSSQAAVTIVSSSDRFDTYGTFYIPTNVSTTLYTYFTLPAGSYRFYVTPYNGSTTTGGFRVTF